MAYQVIARKYRPQRFDDVVGQEHVTRTLRHAVEQNRIAHAYLFCGPRGTGKTTIARIFAKALNCTDGPKADFPEDDPRCQEIAEGRSIDVLEIDGASNRGIDEIRQLRETVRYAPATSRYKIYIIDEVHMLTKEAFNALLKTLEEPPAHVLFMFATTEPDKVLPTILSRCQRHDLRRIPVALIVKHLAHIARQEQVQIEPAALHAIARGAEGCMRDAESALDQLISFCGSSIAEQDVLSMFGLAAPEQILALATAVLKGQTEDVLRELETLTRHGKDLTRLLSDVVNHFRNLLIYHLAHGDLTLLEATESEAATLAAQVPLADPPACMRILEVLTDAEGRLRDAASKKIFLELTLLKAAQARNALSLDAVLQQLQQLRTGSAPGPGAPKPPPARSSVRSPKPTASAPAQSLAAAPPQAGAGTELDLLWQQVLDAAGRASAMTRSSLLEARPVSFEKNVLTIGFDPEFSGVYELANTPRTTALLQTKLQELGHPGVQIKFVLAESAAPRAAAPPQPAPAASAPSAPSQPAPAKREKAAPAALNLEDFKNDPLIQQALEIFKGQIVDVRA